LDELTSPAFEQLGLYDVPVIASARPTDAHAGPLPLWTESKAALIAGYLLRFVQVTHHGTYIDGFAGPQHDVSRWSAKRVVDIELLQHFYLCDRKPAQIKALERLRDDRPGRDIRVVPGDFNVTVAGILVSGLITDKEACFALLDQRTFECQWATVESLANHKAGAHKIEQFYFLANYWLPRALSKVSEARASAWWGRDDWRDLDKMHGTARASLVAKRLRDDLGYGFATSWPIFDRRHGRRTMYYMIHASDHERAPKLMGDAYREAVGPLGTGVEVDLPF